MEFTIYNKIGEKEKGGDEGKKSCNKLRIQGVDRFEFHNDLKGVKVRSAMREHDRFYSLLLL